jgi:hypothetical protein
MMRNLANDSLFKNFFHIGLAAEHCAIVGSGVLYAYGLISDPADLDVLARDLAWDQACTLGVPEPAPFGPVRRILLSGGSIEILDNWFPVRWSTDELIDEATLVEGVKLVKLAVIEKSKEMLNRSRDRKHIEIIRRYLHSDA